MTAPVTADQAAAVLGVTPSLIASWKHRGHVVPVGINDVHQRGTRAVPLYLLEELRPLADAYHQRRGSGSQNPSRVI